MYGNELPKHVVTVEQPDFRIELLIVWVVLLAIAGGDGWLRYFHEKDRKEVMSAALDSAMNTCASAELPDHIFAINGRSPAEVSDKLKLFEQRSMELRSQYLSEAERGRVQ